MARANRGGTARPPMLTVDGCDVSGGFPGPFDLELANGDRV